MRITVLGCGLVGRAIALDLSRQHMVTSVDINKESLKTLAKNDSISTKCADVTNLSTLKEVLADADIVVNALPGFMGFQTLKHIIELHKNVVDISFFEEDPFQLHELARNNGVIAVMDCGVAPGMSNMILGYHYHRMEVKNFECYVGGLPVERTLPYQYKAPFSPVDVIEEYTRPARLVENGEILIKEALSDAEYLHFENIGTLEAFNTDGLRTLLHTMPVPNMKEKTLRYPGHIQLMKIFRESGFFDKTPLSIGDANVRPLDVTGALLFREWKLNPGDQDYTIMKVIVEGLENGKSRRYTYSLLDRYDTATGIHSMARTTGYTCTAVVNLILEGKFTQTGMNPPELVAAQEGCFPSILDYLKQRNVIYKVETTTE